MRLFEVMEVSFTTVKLSSWLQGVKYALNAVCFQAAV